MRPSSYCVFEYLYRDGGNYKTWGGILLEGILNVDEVAAIRGSFEGGEYFIAEQIGVPTLFEQHWSECNTEPSSELDHVWHEFSEIRPATQEDLESLRVWGNAKRLKSRILGKVCITRATA